MNIRIQTPTLLNYAVSTDPFPVVESSKNGEAKAIISITVKANPDIYCKFLTIEVPIGDDQTDLFSESPIAACENSDWSITKNNVPGTGNKNGANTTYLSFKHDGDDMSVSSDIIIQISGTVNKNAGVATIVISEDSMGIDDDAYTPKSLLRDITKTPEVFYLRNLVMVYTGSPGEPVTFIDMDKEVQLEWESNGDTFKVHSMLTAEPYDTLGEKYYKPGVMNYDMAFLVEANKDGKVLYQQYIAKLIRPFGSFRDVDVNLLDANDVSTKKLEANDISTKTLRANSVSTTTLGADDVLTKTLGANNISTKTLGVDNISTKALGANDISTKTLGANDVTISDTLNLPLRFLSTLKTTGVPIDQYFISKGDAFLKIALRLNSNAYNEWEYKITTGGMIYYAKCITGETTNTFIPVYDGMSTIIEQTKTPNSGTSTSTSMYISWNGPQNGDIQFV